MGRHAEHGRDARRTCATERGRSRCLSRRGSASLSRHIFGRGGGVAGLCWVESSLHCTWNSKVMEDTFYLRL